MVASVFDPCFRKLMAQTINVAPNTGTSGFGDPSYGAAVAGTARVEPVNKKFYNANGEEVISEFAIYTEMAIGLLDRVWLPGDLPADPTKARVPMRIYKGIDEDGTLSHLEVFV